MYNGKYLVYIFTPWKYFSLLLQYFYSICEFYYILIFATCSFFYSSWNISHEKMYRYNTLYARCTRNQFPQKKKDFSILHPPLFRISCLSVNWNPSPLAHLPRDHVTVREAREPIRRRRLRNNYLIAHAPLERSETEGRCFRIEEFEFDNFRIEGSDRARRFSISTSVTDRSRRSPPAEFTLRVRVYRRQA